MHSIRTLQAAQSFDEMKALRPELAGFGDPGAVVAHLNQREGDLDGKDRLLAALVTLAQGRGHGELPSSLLWLGLWPGLDAAYRRRLRCFASAPQELVAELGDVFVGLVHRLDLARVHRVAATLVMSTERDVMVRRKRVWAEARRMREDLAEGCVFEDFVQGSEVNKVAFDHWTVRTESQLGLSSATSLGESLEQLHEVLTESVGDDAELLLAVLVLGQSQREAGARLGLSHDAARKRFQRALGRARTQLAAALSQSA